MLAAAAVLSAPLFSVSFFVTTAAAGARKKKRVALSSPAFFTSCSLSLNFFPLSFLPSLARAQRTKGLGGEGEKRKGNDVHFLLPLLFKG